MGGLAATPAGLRGSFKSQPRQAEGQVKVYKIRTIEKNNAKILIKNIIKKMTLNPITLHSLPCWIPAAQVCDNSPPGQSRPVRLAPYPDP